MRFDLSTILQLVALIAHAEGTIKGGASKKAKVIEVGKTALTGVGVVNPASEAKVSQWIDLTVEIANGINAGDGTGQP